MTRDCLCSSIEDAERELWEAGDKADRAYFAWRRHPNPSTWAAWANATAAESRAAQALWDQEAAPVTEQVPA